MQRPVSAITLLELLIVIVLFSLIALGFTSIHSFSYHHIISSDKRTKIQNEVSYSLEHLAKQLSRAIGNERADGAGSVVNPGTDAISIYMDSDAGGGPGNGIRDTADRWVAYRLTAAKDFQYCARCNDRSCSSCNAGWQTLSRKIAEFAVTKPQDALADCPVCLSNNYVEVMLTGRWAAGKEASVDNPEVIMRSRVNMPSVSIN
jgi:hypothetical protein